MSKKREKRQVVLKNVEKTQKTQRRVKKCRKNAKKGFFRQIIERKRTNFFLRLDILRIMI